METTLPLEISPRVVNWHTNLSDFANMVKAFIGSNYLGVAFAFRQSGLAAGIVGLFFIAVLTDHCCKLIVKCKYVAIGKVVQAQRNQRVTNGNAEDDEISEEEELMKIRKQLQRSMTYGDVGQLSMGKFGLYIVNACVFLTQFGFCVGYFILIGNTVFATFPLNTCHLHKNFTNASEFTITNCRRDHSIKDPPPRLITVRDLYESYDNYTSNFTYVNNSMNSVFPYLSELDSELSSNTSTQNDSWIDFSEEVYVSTAPSLKLLVLIPLPLFIFLSYIRNLRHLGPISVAANISILVGCVSIITFLVDGFSLSKTYKLIEYEGLPVFFGLVAGAFEGIGTVIPIESSMEGNRHNFGPFLHGAIGFLSFVLTTFGIMGYLRFGTGVQQMLNANLPAGSDFSLIVNICLLFGVVLTFPLMMYPVIELMEIYTFADGRICAPKKKYYDDDDDEFRGATDRDTLLPSNTGTNISLPVAATISPEVAGWKRNFVRMIIVLIAAGLAVLFRNSFAYILAFVGGIGSTLLAFILPCIFHLKLNWTTMSIGIKIKDIVIIIIGAFCSAVSVYTTVKKLIENV